MIDRVTEILAIWGALVILWSSVIFIIRVKENLDEQRKIWSEITRKSIDLANAWSAINEIRRRLDKIEERYKK